MFASNIFSRLSEIKLYICKFHLRTSGPPVLMQRRRGRLHKKHSLNFYTFTILFYNSYRRCWFHQWLVNFNETCDESLIFGFLLNKILKSGEFISDTLSHESCYQKVSNALKRRKKTIQVHLYIFFLFLNELEKNSQKHAKWQTFIIISSPIQSWRSFISFRFNYFLDSRWTVDEIMLWQLFFAKFTFTPLSINKFKLPQLVHVTSLSPFTERPNWLYSI